MKIGVSSLRTVAVQESSTVVPVFQKLRQSVKYSSTTSRSPFFKSSLASVTSGPIDVQLGRARSLTGLKEFLPRGTDIVRPQRDQTKGRMATVNGIAKVPGFCVLLCGGQHFAGISRGLSSAFAVKAAFVKPGSRLLRRENLSPPPASCSRSASICCGERGIACSNCLSRSEAFAMSGKKVATSNFPELRKNTEAVVYATTASPLRTTGRKVHCFAVLTAPLCRDSGPLSGSASCTFFSVPRSPATPPAPARRRPP